MSTIGKLKIVNREGLMEGEFATLSLALKLQLQPNGLSDADTNDPTHDVFAMGTHGKPVNVGAGWTKTIKRGANEGARFVSFTVDDPSLPEPINLSAFPSARQGELDIVWKRARGAAAARPAAGPAEPPPVDDEVPY